MKITIRTLGEPDRVVEVENGISVGSIFAGADGTIRVDGVPANASTPLADGVVVDSMPALKAGVTVQG